jgi:hypothetical protein
MALIVFSTILLISIAFFMYQNKEGRIGGKMAWCKLFWLDYTLITWFFLPLVFYYQGKSGGVYTTIYALSISMWVRGIIELIMMYGTKNWTPPIGITHDIFTFLLVAVSLIMGPHLELIELIFGGSLLLSLGLETYYAWGFYMIVRHQTKGDDAIWFASKENPAFAQILKVTTVGNIILYPILLWFISNS